MTNNSHDKHDKHDKRERILDWDKFLSEILPYKYFKLSG